MNRQKKQSKSKSKWSCLKGKNSWAGDQWKKSELKRDKKMFEAEARHENERGSADGIDSTMRKQQCSFEGESGEV